MRFLALALVLMMASSCLATNRKTMVVEMHEQEQRQLIDAMSNANDNDHHNIPRKDFGSHEDGAKPKPTGT